MAASPTDPKAQPLPAGYRQGVVSAITVVLGFTLLFVRYWTFEAPGAWSMASDLSALLLALAIVLEFVALWRSLLPEDDDIPVYRVTLRWFFLSVAVLAIAVLIAGLISAHVLN